MCVTVYGTKLNSRRDQPGKLKTSINKKNKERKNAVSENRTSTSEKKHNLLINKANGPVGWECHVISHPAPKSSASTIAVLNPLLEASRATAPPKKNNNNKQYTQYISKALKTGNIYSSNVQLHYFVLYTWVNLFIFPHYENPVRGFHLGSMPRKYKFLTPRADAPPSYD